MIRKPVAVVPRDMTEGESLKRFLEGLKLASSCAAEMRSIQPKRGWGQIHEALNHMLAQGYKLARARGQTRQKLLQGTDEVQRKMDTSAA